MATVISGGWFILCWLAFCLWNNNTYPALAKSRIRGCSANHPGENIFSICHWLRKISLGFDSNLNIMSVEFSLQLSL